MNKNCTGHAAGGVGVIRKAHRMPIKTKAVNIHSTILIHLTKCATPPGHWQPIQTSHIRLLMSSEMMPKPFLCWIRASAELV